MDIQAKPFNELLQILKYRSGAKKEQIILFLQLGSYFLATENIAN